MTEPTVRCLVHGDIPVINAAQHVNCSAGMDSHKDPYQMNPAIRIPLLENQIDNLRDDLIHLALTGFHDRDPMYLDNKVCHAKCMRCRLFKILEKNDWGQAIVHIK